MDVRQVIIIGSGGHAKVVIDILNQDDSLHLVGCIAAQPLSAHTCLHVPILGDDRLLPELRKQGVTHAIIAIGSNSVRQSIAKKLLNFGYAFTNAISKHAYIADSVKLGTGIVVNHGAVIHADTVIGDHAIINTSASVDHDCLVGPYCHIAPGCHIAGHVSIGEGTFLGVGCSVIDQQQIGCWSIVGAGGVVVQPLPDRCLAVGVPARIIKDLH